MRLSDDCKSLEYVPVDPKFKDYFKLTRKLNLDSVQDFIYGGYSMTFKKHNRKNLKLMK